MRPLAETVTVIDCPPETTGAPPPALAVCHRSIVDLHAYWHEKRCTRAMPARADIDPIDLKALLPHLCLVDVVPDERRYVYRLVGTRDVEMRGYDPTGKTVAEAGYAESPGETVRYLDRVVAARKPLLYRGTFRPTATRIETDEVLFLPLSADGAAINMIMLYSHTLWLEDRETPASMAW